MEYGPYSFNLEWLEEEKRFGIVRGYLNNNSSWKEPFTYFGVATLVKRDTHYEVIGLLTKWGKDAHYHTQACKFLLDNGLRISLTFPKTQTDLYFRLFRQFGNIKILDEFTKEYNNKEVEFYYGELIPTGG